jgi:hypothetical protein
VPRMHCNYLVTIINSGRYSYRVNQITHALKLHHAQPHGIRPAKNISFLILRLPSQWALSVTTDNTPAERYHVVRGL